MDYDVKTEHGETIIPTYNKTKRDTVFTYPWLTTRMENHTNEVRSP